MAGWTIQDKKRINLYEKLGVAVREMDTGPADYMLFIDGKACGILKAKREGTELGGVAEQSTRYATSHTKHIERWVSEDQPLPFLYEATNHEIRFRDERDPSPRSRNVFHFHEPETLKNWLEEGRSLRDRMQYLPALDITNLRARQIDAILGRAGIPDATKVTISTIQHMYAQPTGQVLDNFAGSEIGRTAVRREAGRAIDGAQQYFDDTLIGFTAIPDNRICGFSQQTLSKGHL